MDSDDEKEFEGYTSYQKKKYRLSDTDNLQS
jgi:hypothetical protein